MTCNGRMNRRAFCRATAACAVAGSALGRSLAADRPLLRAATFRSDVTPPRGFPSYPSFGPLETIEHPLLAKGVLLPPKLASDPSQAGLFSLRGLHPEQLRELMANPKEAPGSRIGAARRLAFLNRSDRPIELSGLQLGRVHLVHLPGEPMVEFQLDAQRQRPESFVAVAGYGEGCTTYICTAEAFQQGGYEPSAASVGPGAERILKAGIRQLLGLG